MVKIIIGLSIFLILKWFFHENNFYSTDMYIGKKGSGKTCTIAKLSLKYQKKGYKVYSNVDTISNILYFNPKDLSYYAPDPNSVLLIDEVGLIWDNRDFANFKANEFFKYARQYKCKVILFSQAFDIDLKIRNLVDNMFLMTKIGKICLYRPVVKKLGVVKRIDGTGGLEDTYCYGSVFSYKFTYLPRYYGMFKTYNPPERLSVDYVLTRCNHYYGQYKSTLKWMIFTLDQRKQNALKTLEGISKKMPSVILSVFDKMKSSQAYQTGRDGVAKISLYLRKQRSSRLDYAEGQIVGII